ncbi:hypothetical protein PGT21_030121 [Puccinia graminis f. sp. tritici]|uniref:Uncharacterized protein n=1 Tax=Puccinia graminis f. sp. tritici TaxID=56615 RepID=A0A5B0Q7D2_PUCGR|nr:hypothetical protein PGT21_030121 [Puccinia graminis f. sp. tritici]KAA1122503.1 hypothetical protein PGTUg99_037714 [Puccinia graminis f. sp. tritici]
MVAPNIPPLPLPLPIPAKGPPSQSALGPSTVVQRAPLCSGYEGRMEMFYEEGKSDVQGRREKEHQGIDELKRKSLLPQED